MKLKSLVALLCAVSVFAIHATEKQSLLFRMFGAVFSSASTVKEKVFCDTPNQIASVTTVGLVSVIFGWFGYKKYQKQQELIPVQKHELRESLVEIKRKKKYAQKAFSKGSRHSNILSSRAQLNQEKLYEAAVSMGILSPHDKQEMLTKPDIQVQLDKNPETSQLLDDYNKTKSIIRLNKSKIIQVENQLRSLEKKEEDLLRKAKNFGFFDSLFFRSPLKSSKK